jgi:hypothetical protein
MQTQYELTIAMAQQLYADYFAEGINTDLPVTSDLVADGRTDKPITGAQLADGYNLCAALVVDMGIGGAMVKMQMVARLSDANLGLIEG